MTYFKDAACADKTWMTEKGRAEEAKEVCLSCPASDECTAFAMSPEAVGIPGVLAGMTAEQRGLVECECGQSLPKPHTRNGLCFLCYHRELEVA